MSSIQAQNELSAFHRYLGERLFEDWSPEEALDLWRRENPDPDQHAANVAAVRAAIADMEAGDTGRPADEVLAEIRNDLGIADR